MRIVRCNFCNSISLESELIKESFHKYEHCRVCKHDAFLMDLTGGEIFDDADIEELWCLIEDLPVDENERIEKDFLHFKKGDSRYEVWEWFDAKYKKWGGLAALMGKISKK